MIPLFPPLLSFKRKRIFLITHSGADVDAIGAAAALYFSLKRKNRVQILVPEHIALPARHLAKKLQVPYKVSSSLPAGKADVLFLIDFNSLSLAGSLAPQIKRFRGRKYLIDHHRLSHEKIVPKSNSLQRPTAVASCEIVFDLLKEARIPLSEKSAACIASGIIADSAFFLTANSKTFSIMAETMKKSGKTFSTILSLSSVERKFSEKIAMLKAAKRARIYRMGKLVIATADIGAFEATAAATLIKTGADIAFAGDSEEGKLRISGRAKQGIIKRQGFDLAKHVFQRMPSYFPGEGGGHAGAAAFNGKGNDIEKALTRCALLTHRFFSRKKRGVHLKEYT